MTATITQLFVYPVKSLGGIEVSECAAEPRGLRHDRRWMVTDANGQFLTQRRFPQMARARLRLYEDHLAINADDMPTLTVPMQLPADAPVLTVQIWQSVCQAVAVGIGADRWLTEFLSLPSRLVFMPDSTRRAVDPVYARPGDIVSFADGYPILAVAEASLAELNARLVAPLPMDRFRPNLVVAGIPPFAEDRWTRAQTAEVILRGAKPCGRCAIPTVDQATGEPNGPEPLRTLAHYRRDAAGEVLFGQNLLVDRPGLLRVGDVLQTTVAA